LGRMQHSHCWKCVFSFLLAMANHLPRPCCHESGLYSTILYCGIIPWARNYSQKGRCVHLTPQSLILFRFSNHGLKCFMTRREPGW
jgi:hypothetical protein